jgi:CD109 antigen
LQAANGAFSEPPGGRIIHTDMQGGSSQGVALTAYVLIALLENNDTQQIDNVHYSRAVNNARVYLETQLMSISSNPYALSIISYALVLVGSSRANTAVSMLNNLAVVQDGMKHWGKKIETKVESMDETIWRPPYTQSLSVNIEMTSYALLTYALLRDVSAGVPVAKWIVSQRNPNGGFSSTQDTVMALQALATFSSLTAAPSDDKSSLYLTAVYADSSHEFQPVTHQNALVLQTVQIPQTVEQVLITAHGSGVGLVQLNVKYNQYNIDNKAGVVLSVATDQKGNMVSLYTCGRWTDVGQPSGMVVMDINQLTGFSVVNIDEVRQQVGSRLKRIENDDNKIVLYFDELTGDNTCLTIKSEKIQMVSNVQKATVKLYSYYDPSSADTAFYVPPEASAQTNLCSSCPQCCGLPEPQPILNTAPGYTTGHATWIGLLITLKVVSIISCLIIV